MIDSLFVGERLGHSADIAGAAALGWDAPGSGPAALGLLLLPGC